ncbi:PREDICTED: uncharacterized protein LOC108780192 [Cyphomyrmex costatus]|uniref:uncharacterized protein LOC108780192 n=1 Tax=Cyphomyrmex costatus TaxID=456900 RepID=UPI0008523F63|nr:PREDICTED: uncharacterized protein LOC108780192 [Cyphomyrmex costatus]
MSTDKIKRSHPHSHDIIDLALAKFFFGCNISMNVIESELFREFIKLLNPYYKVPSRKKLSHQLLDKVHNEIISKDVKQHETMGVLLIDGWKNSAANSKLIVSTIHTVMDKSVYLNSWDLTGIRETGEVLIKIVNEATEIAKNKFNIRIYAIVSDNASAMILMGNSVDLWHVTCASHSGNLLAKSLVNSKYAESVNRLLREFKQPGPEKEIIERGGQKIILACETRWCSYRDAFRCCLKNLSIMRQIIKDKTITIKTECSKILFSEDFETTLQDYILIFDPVCTLINKCQQSNTNIADACEEWFKLIIPTANDNYEKIIEERLKKALRPSILTANFLHPTYKGKKFMHIEKYRCEVYNFLSKELNVKNLCDHLGIQAFLHGTDIFKILDSKNLTFPHTYWFMASKKYPDLAELADKLMKIPASSAQIERLFSQWSFVHSDIRNRLTTERSQKLIEIYYSLKMSNRCDKYIDDNVDITYDD